MLRRSIFLELMLVIGIVIATAAMGETPPPRALAEAMPMDHDMTMGEADQAPTGFSVATMAANRTAIIAVTPAQAGPNHLAITLINSDGTVMVSREVSAWLSNPALGIEAAQYKATPTAPGEYALAAPLPVAGTWTVEIDALVSDFERAIFVTEIPIR
jgi:copper transport protein